MATRLEKIDQLDDAAEVEIEHPTTGERYGTSMGVYREHYHGVGFRVDRMGDGSAILADSKTPEPTDMAPEQQPVGPQPPAPEPEAPVPSAPTDGTQPDDGDDTP